MLCRWLAVLVLAGFLLVIEAIAVSQGTFTTSLEISRMLASSVVRHDAPFSSKTYHVLAEMFEITSSCGSNLRN